MRDNSMGGDSVSELPDSELSLDRPCRSISYNWNLPDRGYILMSQVNYSAMLDESDRAIMDAVKLKNIYDSSQSC
ncbi:MAG: hypothetical protein HC894_02010 [Microcoleus sp. SM1_3_4]|nr:hypothetical protein [Microcoleus sp. SM1_3_4]